MAEPKNWTINTKNRKVTLFDDSKERLWTGPFYFIQGADCQFGLISRYIEKDEVVTWEKEKVLAEAIVARVNSMEPPPKFFVICGDLVDAAQDSGDRAPQERDFKSIFGRVRADVPLLCVCGNHDVGDTPTPTAVKRYKASFGDDFYSFLCGGVLFLVINSQYLFDASGVPAEAEEHSKWLNETLEHAKRDGIRRIVVFQHIPWFLKQHDEADHSYFSLKRSLRDVWLPKLEKAGVEAIFCGHYHQNTGGLYNNMPVVVTSAIGGQLGEDKSGARIVKVFPDRIEHQYHPIQELPLRNV